MSCIKQRMLYACARAYMPGRQDPDRPVGWTAPPMQIDPPGSNFDFALVGRIPEGILVAIRGTLPPFGSGHDARQVIGDWLNNVKFLPIAGDYPGRVHQGFADSADLLWPGISTAIAVLLGGGPNRLFVTGHSKGGAVANLIAWRARNLAGIEPVVRAYTFAAARAGNGAFRDAFHAHPRLRCVRYEAALDIVPHLPLGAETSPAARRVANLIWPGLADNAYASVGNRLPIRDSLADVGRITANYVGGLGFGRDNAERYLPLVAVAHDIGKNSGYDALVCPGEDGCAH